MILALKNTTVHSKKKYLQIIALIAVLQVACFSTASFAGNLNGYDIMKMADERETGDTQTSNATMILIDKRKNKRIRKLKQFSKEYGEDSKTLTFFLSPADIKDTGFLSFNWSDEGKDDDSWLYLPALRQVKRIAGSDRSGSFMGSDFTFADMDGVEFEDYDYKLVKESEIVDGHDTWVIEALPRKSIKKKVIEETGYVKTISWVRKDIYMAIRQKMWVKKGQKIKFFTQSDIRQVDDIWTAHKIQMVTKKGKTTLHSTVLISKNVKYNNALDDSIFSTQRLERGS